MLSEQLIREFLFCTGQYTARPPLSAGSLFRSVPLCFVQFDEQMAGLGRQFADKYGKGEFAACKGIVHRMAYCTRILEELVTRL